jgi:hypothetical protein
MKLPDFLSDKKIVLGLFVLFLLLGGFYVYPQIFEKEGFQYHLPAENANAAIIALLTMILAAMLVNIYLLSTKN